MRIQTESGGLFSAEQKASTAAPDRAMNLLMLEELKEDVWSEHYWEGVLRCV